MGGKSNRVKLWGADAYVLQTHPPDGEHKSWWRRLSEALGTLSPYFVSTSRLMTRAVDAATARIAAAKAQRSL